MLTFSLKLISGRTASINNISCSVEVAAWRGSLKYRTPPEAASCS